MSFWHEHEEIVVARDLEMTRSVLSFPREAFLYWLHQWSYCWTCQAEEARVQGALDELSAVFTPSSRVLDS